MLCNLENHTQNIYVIKQYVGVPQGAVLDKYLGQGESNFQIQRISHQCCLV